MGKVVGIFAGEITGSVGKVTFRRTNGENIVAQKMTQITNPRTEGQQVQRMKMFTCMKAYSYLKAICDHSFEGISGKTNNMSRFMKLNLSYLDADLSLTSADDINDANVFLNKGENNVLAMNSYYLSEGSIYCNVYPKADKKWTLQSGDESRLTLLADNATDEFVTKDDLQNITVADFHKLLGCEIGTQMTIVQVTADENPQLYLTRYVFKQESATNKVFKLENEQYVVDPAVLDEGSTEVQGDAMLSCVTNTKRADSKYYLSIGAQTSIASPANASAFILSKKENGKWLRSVSSLMWQENSTDVSRLPKFALNSWGVGTNRFLNNATV